MSTNGFAGNVTFSCAAPAGVTCAFSPKDVPVTSGAGSTTLTATTSASVMNYSRGAVHPVGGMVFTGMGLFACSLFGLGQRRKRLVSTLTGAAVCCVVLGTLLMSVGCGGYGSGGNRGTAAVVVTATSGTLTHTMTLNLTVQ